MVDKLVVFLVKFNGHMSRRVDGFDSEHGRLAKFGSESVAGIVPGVRIVRQIHGLGRG